jgi:hypothetical protein
MFCLDGPLSCRDTVHSAIGGWGEAGLATSYEEEVHTKMRQPPCLIGSDEARNCDVVCWERKMVPTAGGGGAEATLAREWLVAEAKRWNDRRRF